MQFVKYLLIAMSIELLCCFGLIEKEKPVAQPTPVVIEHTAVELSAEELRHSETAKPMPIHIKVQ